MKLAVLSESPADEAALRILAEGLLGRAAEFVEPGIRTEGWTDVVGNLPGVLKGLWYRSDAEGLIVVVDSDRSVIHSAAHDKLPDPPTDCRMCRLRLIVTETMSHLRPLTWRSALRVAVGLAVPSIEAWLQCGVDPHVSEATWRVAQQSKTYPYDPKRLKEAVYGTDRPPLALETERMETEALRLLDCLGQLEVCFPDGFGPLAAAVRGW